MGQSFNDKPINQQVGGVNSLLSARDRAVAGGAGAPSVSDLIRQGRQTYGLGGPAAPPSTSAPGPINTPVNQTVGGVANVMGMRDRALQGGAGAPGIADLVGQVNRNINGGPPSAAPRPPTYSTTPGSGSIGPQAGNSIGGMPDAGFGISEAQVAQMRQAALNGQRNPVFGSLPGTGGGVPTVADIIRAQQTRFYPYQS